MDTCLEEDEAWQMQTTCHKVQSGATLRVPAVLKFLAILLSSAFIYVILWGANPLTPKFETAISQILSVSPKVKFKSRGKIKMRSLERAEDRCNMQSH